MSPEEFDMMVGSKRSEALDYLGTTIANFQLMIDFATKQRDAAKELRAGIEKVGQIEVDEEY